MVPGGQCGKGDDGGAAMDKAGTGMRFRLIVAVSVTRESAGEENHQHQANDDLETQGAHKRRNLGDVADAVNGILLELWALGASPSCDS